MRIFGFFLSCFAALGMVLADSETQQTFRYELSARVAALEKKGEGAMAGTHGWLFLTSDLRFLAQEIFWGEAAVKTSRARKGEWADPIPAIVDFQRQLHARGIELLLVPVPPKGEIYPEKLGLAATPNPTEAAPFLHQFYDELRGRGVDVLDLTPTFARQRDDPRGAVFCRTDSHWSDFGCVLAAEAIAEHLRAKLPVDAARKLYATEWKEVAIKGDLAALVARDSPKEAPENIALRVVQDRTTNGAVQPDANSPLLLMGDSHTLVFHDFLAEHAGLLDQLANDLGFAPDLIGTRGSGATAVRVSLYRRARNDPGYLAKKKVIVWCFAAREFTETDQGWVQQPIAK